MSKIKEKYLFLSKNVFLFAICGVLPKILAFIIIPIYTNYLSTAEYGIYDLIHTTADLLMPVFALRIHDAVIRFSLDETKDLQKVFSVGMKITYIGAFIIGIITLVISVFQIVDKVYLLAFFLFYFVVANWNVVSRFCRAINKTSIITIATIVNSVVMYSATLLFLLVFNWGLNGFLFANILGYFASVVVCIIGAKLYNYLTLFTEKELFRQMVCFSFPLIFSALAWWVNNASDRYIITWICGVSSSGIYAVAHKIPSLLAVVQEVFMQAWSVSAIKDFDKDDKDGFISNIYTMLQFGMVFVASALMLLNMPIAKVIYSSDFFDAWRFVPPLLISLCFNAMSLFIDGLLMAINKTQRIAKFTIIGALTNTFANFVLIYLWGPYGAAVATMLGFGLGYLIRVVYSRKYIKLKRNVAREIGVLTVLILQLVVSLLGWKMIPLQFVALVAIILIYLKEIKFLFDFVGNKMRR